MVVHLEQHAHAGSEPRALLPQQLNPYAKHFSLLTQLGFLSKYEQTQSSLAEESERRCVRIEWHEEDEPTCGWLLSEVERVVLAELKRAGQHEEVIDRKWSSMSMVSAPTTRPTPKRRKVIVALKSLKNLEALDQWLLEYERPLFVLEQSDELEIVWGYDDEIAAKRLAPPSIHNFEFVKLLGKGGFSKVIEGRPTPTSPSPQ